MKPRKVDAIVSIDKDAQVVVRNKTEVDWLDSNPNNISEDDIQNKWDELVAEYDANQYQRDRQYPSIGDQLDMQYHDQIDGTTTWRDAIAKVKADNPKTKGK